VKFYIIYYGYLNSSGRAKELIQSIQQENSYLRYTIADSKLISKFNKFANSKKNKSKFIYLLFFLEGYYYGFKNRKKINKLLVIDGAASILGYFLINTLFAKAYLVQDFVEFYERKNFKFISFSNLVLMFEKLLIRRANLVLCANSSRADLMVKYYNLSKKPHVFENIWTLNSSISSEQCNFANKNKDGRSILKLIYTGAINTSNQF
jgi:hypothetical protein